MTGKEIRNSFLAFFGEKEHSVVPSSSLVPQGDPTLLFTNAGMVQFKGIFLGEESGQHSRAVSVQKCLRAGGKHNDLENVGRTGRHHTFFEMLGNFSFGDYFKEVAIELAWEFLTVRLKLPEEQLWVTIFRDDDEALNIWRNKTGLPPEKIVRCGEKDNFWSMGDTGPCGPCSEIHYDQGEDVGCGSPECSVECDCDRYLEIWNLVFMQFSRDEKGSLSPLPRPSIDTGMGLERLAAVVQGKKSNFDTDLFAGIFRHIEDTSGKRYGDSDSEDISMRVIADHIRATVFLISDGVLPSNEGKGYVLRRIMRRASRHGKLLGLSEPFLYLTAGTVADEMDEPYPQLADTRDHCSQVIRHEEERFLTTLDHGLKLLEEEIAGLRTSRSSLLPGNVAFKLYDTYGFPLDLTEDILKGENIAVDTAGFEKEMKRQRETARLSWTGSGEGKTSPVYSEISSRLTEEVSFVGYDTLESEARVLFLIRNGELVDTALEGEDIEVVTDRTPFYSESGGQAADKGTISGQGGEAMDVSDTQRPLPGLITHRGKIGKGSFKQGQIVKLSVSPESRLNIIRNHTATHLLHAALRNVLGDHVKQAGSMVSGERLRFDFSHFAALTSGEIKRVEEIVNSQIWENREVKTEILSIDEARSRGAMALFGEKYGKMVRVVAVPDFSTELCGGTHVNLTGEIGPFKILSESGVAAGVRRVEAVTGIKAYNCMVETYDEIKDIGALVKGSPGEIGRKVEGLIKKQKGLESEIENLKEKLASSGGKDLAQETVKVAGVNFLASRVDVADARTLRTLMDNLKSKIKSGIIVLGAPEGDKALLIAGVTDDLTARFHAGRIISGIAPIVGGKGGGRPDMAQAGGKDVSKLEDALREAKKIIEATD